VKRLLDITKRAAQDAALVMTHQLQTSALQHGWDADVVANTRVVFEDGKFSTQVHPDYAERAHKHEYGTEDTRPTGVIRKAVNNPKTGHDVLMSSINHHWKASK
jgi:hypothetical protein